MTAFAQHTVTTGGPISPSAVGTFMAITGDGFFNVQRSSGTVDNAPVFTGVTDYTRRGDFQLNANGNLVNGGGYYLMGVDVDPKTGNPRGNVPKVLQFQNTFIPAQATTTLIYSANLAAKPLTIASASAGPNTLKGLGGLNPGDFSPSFNPLVAGTPPQPFTNGSALGPPEQNQVAPPALITGATALSGAANSNSLPNGFAVNDQLIVNGTTIHFVAAGATAPDLNITDNVSQLLARIDSLSGNTTNPSTVTGGAITLNTGIAANLTITFVPAAAGNGWGSLGFGSPVIATRGGGGGVGTGVVTANDQATFLNESISGSAITAYDATGTATNLQLRWAKSDSAALGVGHSDTWNLFYQSNANATGTQTAWLNVGTNFVFGPNGTLTSPAGSSINIPNVTVGNQTLGNLTFSFGTGGLTQFATTSGRATIGAATQNGFAAGQLQSVAVNNSGIVVGTFSNGQNLDLAQVSLSHFNGTNYLKALDGGGYEVTDLSGPAIDGASGAISGSSLEGSNTDIADEFTKLIVTQQAYSANTKVITTANSMVQDLLNVLR